MAFYRIFQQEKAILHSSKPVLFSRIFSSQKSILRIVLFGFLSKDEKLEAEHLFSSLKICFSHLLLFDSLLHEFRTIAYLKEVKKHMKGTIKWYNARKGYGFIQSDDNKDVFVHRSAIPMGVDLYEGDNVEFEIEDSDRGPQAKNLKKA